MVKIGLIGRCEIARGLGVQSKGFYDALPVDRVLLVRYPPPYLDCEENPSWYPGATHITYDGRDHTLPQNEVMDWLSGLDVVFTCETPYDWRLPDWARSVGCKTVVQGNPEFFRHDKPEFGYKADPDEWWWPTPWRLDRLPTGRVMPVPMPDRERTNRTPPDLDGRIHFIHVVGKRAYEDRNGTDIFLAALRHITEECDVTVYGYGHELPEHQLPIGSPVRFRQFAGGTPDRWDLYTDASVLVMPRRYGGNSLPALEAAACGVGVSMSQVSPNETMASRLIPCMDSRLINLACGRVHSADVDQATLGADLNLLAVSPDTVARMQSRSFESVPRWSEYASIYMDAFEQVAAR